MKQFAMMLSVLAVAVSAGRMGFVFISEGTVQDWGTSAKKTKSAAATTDFVRDQIEQYNPDVVATEALGPTCRKRAETKTLIVALAQEAARHEVLDISVPLPQINGSKYDAAVELVGRHPALMGYLPPQRPRFFDNTPRGYLLFDAVLLAEAALNGPTH